jgi:hypothetical protein
MMIFNVSNVSGLRNAVDMAKSGDQILLAPGIYSDVDIKGKNFGDGITISSKSSENPAVVSGMNIRDSEGVYFNNLKFKIDPKGLENQVVVYESRDIHFSAVEMYGSLNGNPGDDQSGLMIRFSSNVSVENSEFHELQFGITFLESDNISANKNAFHDIRSDGIRGSGVADVEIKGNYFTDFFPAAGDHPDAIQLWEGASVVSRNILIDGNVVVRGEGGMMQGVFLRGPAGTFEDVIISKNTVAGGMTNGIFVAGANRAEVSANTVLGTKGDTSWIRIEESGNVAVTDNQATKYIYGTQVKGLTETGNALTGYISEQSLRALELWVEGDHTTKMPSLIGGGGAEGGSTETGSGGAIVPPQGPIDSAPELFKIVGSSRADNLTVVGRGGDTRIEAGGGHDRLTGGEGQNTLLGGAGDDTYFIKDGNDVVVEGLRSGSDEVVSTVNYTLTDNVEHLRLLQGANVGTGNSLNNHIIGAEQSDQLSGLNGNDRLNGGGARDLLLGGDGNDTLTGGHGSDTVVGGAGADTFTFGIADFSREIASTDDRIDDFSHSQGDRIHLSTLDANTLTPVNDKLVFVGTSAFHGRPGELRYEVKGGDAYVMGDLNGDKMADFQIQLIGVKALQAEDFVL